MSDNDFIIIDEEKEKTLKELYQWLQDLAVYLILVF